MKLKLLIDYLCFQEQKKSFLAQLAAISNMSKEEVNEVVESAVNGECRTL